ncbi:MAG: HAD family hydrolase [Pyrobaculum sp.]
MNYLLSFWGLLAPPVDFWNELSQVLGGHISNPGEVITQVAWVVEGIRSTGYEVPLRTVVRIVAERIGVDPLELEEEYIRHISQKVKPAPCSLEFLQWAKARGVVAIVSNTPCICFIKNFLDGHRVEINNVYTSDLLLRRKPSRRVFRYVLRRLNIEPSDAIYIGDGEDDLGAMAVGLFTIIVGRGDMGHLSLPDLCEVRRWLEENIES